MYVAMQRSCPLMRTWSCMRMNLCVLTGMHCRQADRLHLLRPVVAKSIPKAVFLRTCLCSRCDILSEAPVTARSNIVARAGRRGVTDPGENDSVPIIVLLLLTGGVTNLLSSSSLSVSNEMIDTTGVVALAPMLASTSTNDFVARELECMFAM